MFSGKLPYNVKKIKFIRWDVVFSSLFLVLVRQFWRKNLKLWKAIDTLASFFWSIPRENFHIFWKTTFGNFCIVIFCDFFLHYSLSFNITFFLSKPLLDSFDASLFFIIIMWDFFLHPTFLVDQYRKRLN